MDMFSNRLRYCLSVDDICPPRVNEMQFSKNISYMFSSCLFLPCSCHGKAEECIGLCRAMLCTVVWLLQGCAWYCERLRDPSSFSALESSLRACMERMANLLHSTKNRALVHIARLEEQGAYI